jgi:hypothetical protein
MQLLQAAGPALAGGHQSGLLTQEGAGGRGPPWPGDSLGFPPTSHWILHAIRWQLPTDGLLC